MQIAVGILYPDGFIIGVNAAGGVLALVQICLIQYVGWRRKALGLPPVTATVEAKPDEEAGEKAIELGAVAQPAMSSSSESSAPTAVEVAVAPEAGGPQEPTR